MPHDDATHELIAAARGGDRGAFDALAALHRSRLQGIVEQRLGPELRGRLAVDDVLQETFLRAFRGLARFRSTMSRIHPRQRLQPARPPHPHLCTCTRGLSPAWTSGVAFG